MLIATLRALGIDGRRMDAHDQSGVWVGGRKIASIGVRCARWVTTHGFSLNVDLDLAVYETFDACGLGGAQFTSISRELGTEVTVEELRPTVFEAFAAVFEVAFEPLPVAVYDAVLRAGTAAAGVDEGARAVDDTAASPSSSGSCATAACTRSARRRAARTSASAGAAARRRSRSWATSAPAPAATAP